MYFFCTYFDQHYLDKGLALVRSLERHCSPFRMWILCMDEITFEKLTQLSLEHVDLVRLSELEKSDDELLQAKQNRSLIEYYFTCTPSLIFFLIQKYPDIDILTYLDADLFFFSSISPAYDEMNEGSVLIIGHRFPHKLIHREIYGKYNVGLLSFRNDSKGRECLAWWRSRCLEWCYDRVEGNKFADQKYLDKWPGLFEGIVILQNKSIGLAPWNIDNYYHSINNNCLNIDGIPVIMYHFHGLKPINKWIFDCNLSQYYTRMNGKLKKFLYYPYILELKQARKDLRINSWVVPDKRTTGYNKGMEIRFIRNKFPAIKQYLHNAVAVMRKLLANDYIFV